jgi:HK97 family phage major capsid protein
VSKTTTIPKAPQELEEMLGDPARMQEVFKDKAAFGEFIRNYAQNVLNRDTDIARQVQEETQRVLVNWLRENQGDNVRRLNLSPDQPVASLAQQRNKLYNAKAPGATIDNAKSRPEGSADFFQAIWHHVDTLSNASALRVKAAEWQKIQNSFGSTVPADGGFLIPETLRSELLSVALETAIVRPRARVIPMESLRVPFPAVDDASHVSSVFGGIICYWTEEGAGGTESQASFSQVALEAKELIAYSEAPNALVADAPAFGAFIDQVLPEAIAWYEDDAFINGSGVGQPLGFRNASAVVSVAKESGQAADTIVWENIVKMFARMLPSSLGRAVWLASIDTFPELATMALSVGTGGSAVWLNNGAEGPPMTILGRPVIFTEKCPVLGDAGDLNFVDFGYYLLGDRQTMQALSSPHFKFSSNKTAYRVVERVDGRPWLNSAITPKNGGPTLSPYVNIAARA